jgi:hypothetical protein
MEYYVVVERGKAHLLVLVGSNPKDKGRNMGKGCSPSIQGGGYKCMYMYMHLLILKENNRICKNSYLWKETGWWG